jgi:hypothetical protein
MSYRIQQKNVNSMTCLKTWLDSGSQGGEHEHENTWDIAPCSLVEADRRFRGACHQDYELDVWFNETGVYVGMICEPGSSVSIVSGCRLDNRAIEARSPADAKEFFL